jgi:hypothetical protein
MQNSAAINCYLAFHGDPALPRPLGAGQAPPEDALELLRVHVDRRLLHRERRRLQEHLPPSLRRRFKLIMVRGTTRPWQYLER